MSSSYKSGISKKLLVYLRFIINHKVLAAFVPNQRQVYPMKTKEGNESSGES